MTVTKEIAGRFIELPDYFNLGTNYVEVNHIYSPEQAQYPHPSTGVISQVVAVPDITQVNFALGNLSSAISQVINSAHDLAETLSEAIEEMNKSIAKLRADIEFKIGPLERHDPVPDNRFEGLAGEIEREYLP